MKRPVIAVSCPIDTYSGYGARARDFVQALIDIDKYDVKILPQKWGETRWGYLKEHNAQQFISRIVHKLEAKPDVWIQVTIPNEFQKVGTYNIGLTAGIETTICDPTWIQGANNMDLMLVSSNHSLESFKNSKYDLTDNRTGQIVNKVELQVKTEILFEGVDLNKYRILDTKDEWYKSPADDSIVTSLNSIPESFCFFTTGHWMRGDFGEDRKNMGFTIKAFLETFKNKPKPPALIVKTHTVTTSIMDKMRVEQRIDAIKKTVKGSLPNIYVIHGEISDEEINYIYNHPKVKAFVSLPKGEGFGRPFLEFSCINKPIIASGWSGQLDFLDKEYVRLVNGFLKPVHASAQVEKILLPQAQWFAPDPVDVARAFKDVYDNYKKWSVSAKRQGFKNRISFSYEKMVDTLRTILDTNLPEFAQQVDLALPTLNLPKLQRVDTNTETPKITLPKLKKT